MNDDEREILKRLLESGDPEVRALIAGQVGRATSEKKAASSAANGKRGGRPPGAKNKKSATIEKSLN